MQILYYIIVWLFIFKIVFYSMGFVASFVITRMYRYHNKKEKVKQEDNTLEILEVKQRMIHNRIKNMIRMFIDGLERYMLLVVGKIPSHLVRKIIYKVVFLVQIEKNAVIYGGAEIRQPELLKIGKGSIIGDEAKLDARNGIEIGDNVNFSTAVWIWTEQHDVNSISFSVSRKTEKRVAIGSRVWLGSRVTVLPGVIIGEGAVVASGAVVTKDLEPFGIYAGIPAKKIGERNPEISYDFDGSHYYFW